MKSDRMMLSHNLPILRIRKLKYAFLPFILLVYLVGSERLLAQEPITWDQLAELLDPYFAPELIGDIKTALPAMPFDVWGFDVGDYSGDGYNDLIVSSE